MLVNGVLCSLEATNMITKGQMSKLEACSVATHLWQFDPTGVHKNPYKSLQFLTQIFAVLCGNIA